MPANRKAVASESVDKEEVSQRRACGSNWALPESCKVEAPYRGPFLCVGEEGNCIPGSIGACMPELMLTSLHSIQFGTAVFAASKPSVTVPPFGKSPTLRIAAIEAAALAGL